MTSYLISGSSRGLGLALVAELAAKPASEVSKVFAAVRTETNEVKQLAIDHRGRVELISMDANLEDSIRAAVAKVEQSLGGQGLDVLINVAGMSSVAMGGIEQM
jgi:NAD(P)-dependent dehydrogenase (short-subunit alcohol dehydrogenase family)